MAMAEKLTPYQRLVAVYDGLPADDPRSIGRSKTLKDQSQVTLTLLTTEAQEAIMVSCGGTSFYLSEKGVEWISPPQIKIDVGYSWHGNGGFGKILIPVSPFLNIRSPADREDAINYLLITTLMLTGWVEDCIEKDRLLPPPFRPTFQ